MDGHPGASAGAEVPNLQDAVLRLQRFWSSQGCLLLPPCDFEVPFAALHPDAFFRTLGPNPWRAAYLQPVRRPLDGRYGRHPFRLSKHHQLAVVLKPPVDEVQTIYLASLESLGLDLSQHDVRFAEWRWQPRSLGASGFGWHALVDGLGITRLTFLERVADRDLEPMSFEISYGLERLLMLLQGFPSAYAVSWSGDTDYGRVRRRDEEEVSRYVFETADATDLQQRLEILDREAGRCLESGLARPAYELAVRCLEPIDVLEARGAVSGRERERWLDRVRERVVAAADLHLARQAAEIETADPVTPVEPAAEQEPEPAGQEEKAAPGKGRQRAAKKGRSRRSSRRRSAKPQGDGKRSS